MTWRTLAACTVGSGVISALFTFGVMMVARPPVVEAQGRAMSASVFRVVDDGGRSLAALGVQDDGTPALYMYDGRGTKRLALNVVAGSTPAVSILDAQGRVRGGLWDSSDGPALLLWDAQEQVRARLWVTGTGTANLIMADGRGRDRLMIFSQADGLTNVAVLDERGELVWYAPE